MTFDVIVVGAGHAGCEAAFAAARLGAHVGLCTLTADTVAHMPCNPAVGGTAKGHLVREIDALGGLMGRAIDATGIQFKLLNRSRGPAVWSPRAQADKKVYGQWVRRALESEPNIEWLFGRAGRISIEHGRVIGLTLEDGREFKSASVVITTGTFLNGLIHIGRSSGRPDVRRAAVGRSRGVAQGDRLRMGPAEDRHAAAAGSREHRFRARRSRAAIFRSSAATTRRWLFLSCPAVSSGRRSTAICCTPTIACAISCAATSRSRRSSTGRFAASVRAIARRSKTRSFASRTRSGIRFFSSPKASTSREIYVNGFSMSLPRDVQAELVHALPGLEDAVLLRPGYAVEYDFIQPTELTRRLETKRVEGLFLAGQINGTSGTRKPRRRDWSPASTRRRARAGRIGLEVGRDEGYIGILVDDLITKGCLEPYRMFTSRAEHRLLLRIDNADLRLTPKGREVGLVDDERWEMFEARKSRLENNLRVLDQTLVRSGDGRSRSGLANAQTA